jgi:hypothetical protein
MIDPDLKDLWTPTGLLLGFQATLFKWRIERESEVGDKGDIPWLVPSDYIGIASMLLFVFGVFLFPLSGIVSAFWARLLFGLGALFFVGQSLGLAGHYQLYNRTKLRRFIWFPLQEKIVTAGTILIAIIYLIISSKTAVGPLR